MNIRNQPRSDTKTRILDTAERLFALRGFQRTSIKRLACEAKANLAAVNYYFGSKAALIEKVIERRLRPINQQRMQRLEALQQDGVRQGCRPFCEDVLRAFIEPSFTLTEIVRRERYFLAIAGRAFSEPDDAIRSIFMRHFKPPFLLLFQLMKTALPGLPEAVLWWRLHFAIGAMVHCMHMCGTRLSAPDFSQLPEDANTVVKLLIPFVTNGMKAPYHRENEKMLGLGS
ncbi:MAG: TetR family transcriptional regulator [Deltaproteobacteria bacterium]|nr:TetR family transcriptional regulator [Deltaproteobacteria bacterium]